MALVALWQRLRKRWSPPEPPMSGNDYAWLIEPSDNRTEPTEQSTPARSRHRRAESDERTSKVSCCTRWSSRSERCLSAAGANLIAIILLMVAVTSDEWVSLSNCLCKHVDTDCMTSACGQRMPHFGATLFYAARMKFSCQTADNRAKGAPCKYELKHSDDSVDLFDDCVTVQSARVIEYAIAMCYLASMVGMMAVFLHLLGPRHPFLKWLRRTTLIEVASALMLCATLALSFYHASLVQDLQVHSANVSGNDAANNDVMVVNFGSAFYLIAVSALCNIAALVISQHTTIILLRARRQWRAALSAAHEHRTTQELRRQSRAAQGHHLLSFDELATAFGISTSELDQLPPPPPSYTEIEPRSPTVHHQCPTAAPPTADEASEDGEPQLSIREMLQMNPIPDSQIE